MSSRGYKELHTNQSYISVIFRNSTCGELPFIGSAGGIIPRTARGVYPFEQSVRRYVQHRRKEIAQRASRGSDEEVRERARKLKRQNDRTEAELVNRADAVEVIDAIVALIKAELETVAARVTDDPALRREIANQMAVVTDALDGRHRVAVADLRAGRDALELS